MNPWLTKPSLQQLVKIKMSHPDAEGIDVFTAMAMAAYKQWDDVEFLLSVAPEAPPGETIQKIETIRQRHDLYLEAQKGRTDSVFP